MFNPGKLLLLAILLTDRKSNQPGEIVAGALLPPSSSMRSDANELDGSVESARSSVPLFLDNGQKSGIIDIERRRDHMG